MSLLSKILCSPTPPSHMGQEPWEAWLTGFLILSIFLLFIIIYQCLIIRDKSKAMKLLAKTFIFTNKNNNDIIVISKDYFNEIEIEFTLYKQNNEIIKKYSIKELDFSQNEQRVIANLKDFNAHRIGFKIISCK